MISKSNNKSEDAEELDLQILSAGIYREPQLECASLERRGRETYKKCLYNDQPTLRTETAEMFNKMHVHFLTSIWKIFPLASRSQIDQKSSSRTSKTESKLKNSHVSRFYKNLPISIVMFRWETVHHLCLSEICHSPLPYLVQFCSKVIINFLLNLLQEKFPFLLIFQ